MERKTKMIMISGLLFVAELSGGARSSWSSTGRTMAVSSRARGKILWVDNRNRNLLLRMEPGGTQVSFSVSPRALLAQGSCQLEMADIGVGDQVKVAYQMRGEEHVAEEIQVLESGPSTSALRR